MSWIIVFPAGVLVGILFASIYPEMASGINDTISPPIEAVGDSLANGLRDGILSIMGN